MVGSPLMPPIVLTVSTRGVSRRWEPQGDHGVPKSGGGHAGKPWYSEQTHVLACLPLQHFLK